jgi:ankyrin repeat protein
LLDGNALPDIGDEFTGRTPLMYAVLNRNIEMVKSLVIASASVGMCDFQCITPLMLACSKGDLTCVKIFCNKFADVDDQDENGWTALHYCCQANAPKVIRYLIYEEGANRHLKDHRKRKPIDFAKFLDHGECVALLASSGSLL